MQDVCFSWQLVFVGTLCTTLSSALSGLVGTARVLQAISLDFPAIGWLAKVSGDDGEPRRAVVVSYVVSQMTLFIGRVNDIAPVRQFHCASGLCKRAVQAYLIVAAWLNSIHRGAGCREFHARDVRRFESSVRNFGTDGSS
jgi:amino acid transporter